MTRSALRFPAIPRILILASVSTLAGCVSELPQYFTPNVDPAPTTPSDGTAGGGTTPGSNPDTTVCEPFVGDGPFEYPPTDGHGLQAKLRYLSDDMPRYRDVMSYVRNGIPLEANLYFAALNTPTRPFDRGFINQNGQPLTRADGTALYEYFSLEFQAKLVLPEGAPGAKVQFALLSDDGAIMSINNGDGYKTIIDNDGTHPTRMGCAQAPTTLSQLKHLPIRVTYYQGPRHHIALVLLMREWEDSCDFEKEDPLCGSEGNDFFFDSTQTPSAPTDNYRALLSRGWKPVPPEYFKLPGDPPPANPCF